MEIASKEKTVTLGYTDYTSDKIYIVNLYPDNKGPSNVTCKYGKRYNANRQDIKASEVSYNAAAQIFDKITRQKLNKGYEVESGSL